MDSLLLRASFESINQSIHQSIVASLHRSRTDELSYASLVQQALALPSLDPAAPFALVLTKPPETVLLLCPPPSEVRRQQQQQQQQQQSGASSDVGSGGWWRQGGRWVLVDSHSRPQLGRAGGFALGAASLETLVKGGFKHVFPPVLMDEDPHGAGMSMMEAMYNAIEAYPIQLAASVAAEEE